VDEELDGVTKESLNLAHSGKDAGGGGGGTFEMTVNHSKILILISKFAQVKRPLSEKEIHRHVQSKQEIKSNLSTCQVGH